MGRLKKPNNNFTITANFILNDVRLTLKAKGLYTFLLSKPDDWTFSARLIATQNKDSIDSISSGLRELEAVGLLQRLPIQGGYDYEIFDSYQVHLVENPLSGKSSKQLGKIHLVENPLSISKKEFKAIEEEERDIVITDSFSLSVLSSCENDISTFDNVKLLFPKVDLFVNYLLSVNKNIKSPIAYRASIYDALHSQTNKHHEKTVFAYCDFDINGCPSNQVLPIGVNIFDIIGRD